MGTATHQSGSIAISSKITKTGRSGHYSLRKNLHLEGLVPNYPIAQCVLGKKYQAPLAVAEDSHITPDEEDLIGILLYAWLSLMTITTLVDIDDIIS